MSADSGCMIDLGKASRQDYAGCWIAFIDNQVVAVEKTAKAAFLSAKRNYPKKIAFVTKVPEDSVMLL